MGAHDGMIKSVVNEFHWSPEIIDNLYCDDIDYKGLLFWYQNLEELHSNIPKPS